LRSQGFNIIIGDTVQMLQYLKEYNTTIENMPGHGRLFESEKYSLELLNYMPPKNDDKLISYKRETLFVDYTPQWSHIYSDSIPKTVCYKEIADSIMAKRNTVVIGIRGSGKTTLMMQLIIELDVEYAKHYLNSPSLEEAKTYLNILNGSKSLLFIDNCFRDTDALIILFRSPNVQLVCFDRDFNYEQQFYRIQDYDFNFIEVTHITKENGQSIIDFIPADLKKWNASTKKFERDQTIPSLLASVLKATNFKFIWEFHKKDPVAANVFLMICYVHACGIPCSFDMVYSYLGDETYNWKEMLDAVKRAGGLISDGTSLMQTYDVMELLQDYYQCRSRFFAEKIIGSIPKGKGNRLFAQMLNDFANYVPVYKIYKYDRFRRRGYDADFAHIAFSTVEEGEEFYNICRKKDDSIYIYQQAAIYFSRIGEYKKAFNWIEMARNQIDFDHFSIESTYAKIYFDVNVYADQAQAIAALKKLEDCCTQRNKRKFIHFVVFARCVLEFHHTYNDEVSVLYIRTALDYVNEGIDSANIALSHKNKNELINLKNNLIHCLSKLSKHYFFD
jgi:hypothetical protein